MKFAVELNGPEKKKTPPTNRVIVKTGDDADLLPYSVAMIASGLGLAAIGAACVIRRRRDAQRGGHRR